MSDSHTILRIELVTINYRLGPLGFLDLPALAADTADHSAGMYWLQDQQATLRWVRGNIAAFGGDAGNVTIFGESAGGQSVCYNLASPLSAGLFERAITQSGPCSQPTQTAAAAQATGTRFARQVGCDDRATVLGCLRALPAGELINAPVSSAPALEPWTPNVDRVELRAPETVAIASGAFNRVPTIEGTTHDEYRAFVWQYADSRGTPVTAAQYVTAVRTVFGGEAQQVLDQYPVGAYASPGLALAAVGTDSLFSCPARSSQRALAASVPTYAYEFSDPHLTLPLRDPVMPLGAPHAAELPFLFAVPQATLSSAQRKLSDRVIGYWTSFAATGSPKATAAPSWFRYSAASDQVMELTSGGGGPAAGFAGDHHCSFWASRPELELQAFSVL